MTVLGFVSFIKFYERKADSFWIINLLRWADLKVRRQLAVALEQRSKMIFTKQFTIYIIIGLTTNGLSFLGFAGMTWLGLNPEYAISIIYPVQISLTFLLNKSWTFSHEGRISASAVRYLIAYVSCYVLNVAALKYFNGYCGYSHLLVQAVAVVVLVPLLFSNSKDMGLQRRYCCDPACTRFMIRSFICLKKYDLMGHRLNSGRLFSGGPA